MTRRKMETSRESNPSSAQEHAMWTTVTAALRWGLKEKERQDMSKEGRFGLISFLLISTLWIVCDEQQWVCVVISCDVCVSVCL
jgi:hypothetical protein